MFRGLQARLTVGLIILVCFTLAIVAYSLLQDSHRQLKKFQLTQAKYQAKTLAEGSLDALVTHDYELLERWVASSLPSKEYAYAYLSKPNGLILTHTNIDLIGHKEDSPKKITETIIQKHTYLSRPILEVIHPAYIGSKHIANAHIAYYLDEELSLAEESVPLIITAIMLSVFALSIGSFFITRKIIAPIKLLTKAISVISPDKKIILEKTVLDRHDEVGTLARTFSAISGHLYHSYKELKQKSIELEERVIERTSELTSTNKTLAESEQRMSTIVENIADAIVIVDESGQIESCNNAAQQMFGYSNKELLGNNISILFPELSNKENNFYIIQSEGREVNATKNSSEHFPIEMSVRNIIHDEKNLYLMVIRDITERKAMIDDLKHIADHDPLTGLLNRAYFQAQVRLVYDLIKNSNSEPCAILFIDLDNFKYVNDTLGHAAGDRVLIDVTNILQKRTRKSDILCRLGGDEFTVLIYDTTLNLAEDIANSFRKKMSEYIFQNDDGKADVGCSVGVSIITKESESAEQAISQADYACHQAKNAGRNCVKLFQHKDKDEANKEEKDEGWSRKIKHAIEHNLFEFVYQPIQRTSDQKVSSAEVYLRMRDEDEKLILPAAFLPYAERFGLMADIDHWVIRHTIETLAKESDYFLDLNLSINISPYSIYSEDFYTYIEKLFENNNVKPNKLTLEVTEKTVNTNLKKSITQLNKLKMLGCNIALDDFGSGHASFSLLERLPIDIVKIDSSFTRQLSNPSFDKKMLFAINTMACSLNIQVVAKHIEHKDVFNIIKRNNIEYVQGFHIKKPEESLDEVFVKKNIKKHEAINQT